MALPRERSGTSLYDLNRGLPLDLVQGESFYSPAHSPTPCFGQYFPGGRGVLPTVFQSLKQSVRLF